MSEKNFTTISPEFDKGVKIDFTGETVTSNAGVMMLAELDDKLGVIGGIASRLSDPRNPDFTVHTMQGGFGDIHDYLTSSFPFGPLLPGLRVRFSSSSR